MLQFITEILDNPESVVKTQEDHQWEVSIDQDQTKIMVENMQNEQVVLIDVEDVNLRNDFILLIK